jgi:hypothetical protein
MVTKLEATFVWSVAVWFILDIFLVNIVRLVVDKFGTVIFIWIGIKEWRGKNGWYSGNTNLK